MDAAADRLSGQRRGSGAGLRDVGSCDDIRDCLDYAATILSIGDHPPAYNTALSVDGLITAARERAAATLAQHAPLVDALASRVVDADPRYLTGQQLDDLFELYQLAAPLA